MQIETTVKHHYTPMRMAKIKKALTLGKVPMGLESKYTLLSGVRDGAAALENSLAVSYQVNIHSPYDPKIKLLGIHPHELKIYVQKKTTHRCL